MSEMKYASNDALAAQPKQSLSDRIKLMFKKPPQEPLLDPSKLQTGPEIQSQTQPQIQQPKKFFDKFKSWNKNLKTNPLLETCGEKPPADVSDELELKCSKYWSFGKHASRMMFFAVIALVVTDALLLSEMFVTNKTFITVVHILRILIFIGIIIVCIISYSQGFRQSPISPMFDIMCKFFTFAIATAYLITIGVRYGQSPSTMGILKIVAGTAISLMCLIFLIMGIVEKIKGAQYAYLSQTPFIFWSFFGIVLSAALLIETLMDHDSSEKK